MTEFPKGLSSNSETNEHLYKICILGDIGTGKTSIVKQLVHSIFSEHYKSTIGVDFGLKKVIMDDKTYGLHLWDIAGQERFGNMTRVYYKGSVGAFIVADATRITTIDATKKWKSDFDAKSNWESSYSPEIGSDFNPTILLINKIDLLDDESRSQINFDKFCKENGFHCWFAISTKLNEGVNEACHEMVNICKNSIPLTQIKHVKPDVKETVQNEPLIEIIPNSDNENNAKLFMCKFMTEIFKLVNNYNHIDDDMNAKIIVNKLKMIFHDIYFDEAMVDFRKVLSSNHKSLNHITDIHNMLVNMSMQDSTKIIHISNYVLNYGKSLCS